MWATIFAQPVSSDRQYDTVPDQDGEISSSVSRAPRSEAALTVLRGPNVGALFQLGEGDAVIGRSPDVEVPIPDDTLSRRHACISRVGDVFAIEDLDSTNGTLVDGEPVQGACALDDGARIHLGNRTVLHFRLHDPVELQAAQQVQDMALRDPLTGLFNRRHMQDQFWSEVAYAERHRSPLSLLLLDVDHFKRINDTHGHAIGDAVLRDLADALRELTRSEDLLARYGGEEFALVARGISRDQTVQLAGRICETIAARTVDVEGLQLRFTVSIGVAHVSGGAPCTTQEMFAAADRALYASKDAGRNSVSIAPPE